MKYYRFTAKLLAPFMVQRNRQSNAPQGLPYLPGSALRGALAAKYLREGGSPDAGDFKSLFIDNLICFPDLFPADDPQVISRVLPSTGFSCKRFPGFRFQGGHGVSDTLIFTTAARIRKKPVGAESWICPVCGNDKKTFSGFWNGDGAASRKYEPTITFERHTGIDRVTGTVAQSIFFTTQAISNYRKDPSSGKYEVQHLTGGIFAEENQIKALEPLISGPLFVGADRSRGMGELALSIAQYSSPSFDIPGWNRAFGKKFRDAAGANLPTGLYFTVNLESHAILTDRFLRPSASIDLSFPDIHEVLKVAKSQTVRGWQATYGLPKPDDVVLSMGSVFLFRYDGTDEAALKSYLNQLAVAGLGLRREEGFGRISICDPFHTMEEIL